MIRSTALCGDSQCVCVVFLVYFPVGATEDFRPFHRRQGEEERDPEQDHCLPRQTRRCQAECTAGWWYVQRCSIVQRREIPAILGGAPEIASTTPGNGGGREWNHREPGPTGGDHEAHPRQCKFHHPIPPSPL